jgi:arrestin-related trafficking adapter 3/6
VATLVSRPSTTRTDRNAEFRESTGPRDPSTPGHEVHSPADVSLSRRVSFEDQHRPEFVLGSSTGRTQSQASIHPPYNPTRNYGIDAHSPHPHEDGRGRPKGKRLSSIGMFFDAVKERVRSVSRAERDTPPHSVSRSRDARDHSPDRRDSSIRRGRTREPKERSTLERVTEIVGHESEDEEAGDGWKEFRKGKSDFR